MLKAPRKFKKMLILPCLCSITFYLGSQMMTYTEAAFIHETKVQATISTASIFPKTVDQLTKQAIQHKEVILHEYGEMKSKLTFTSTQELEQTLATWKQGREKIVAERELLQKVYVSIENPYNEVKEELKKNKSEPTKQVFSYVNAGFHIVKENCEYVDKEVNLQVIDKQIQAFEKLLVDEIEKQKNLEESKKQEEAEKLEENKKQEEAKKLEESKKQEEAKKLEESKKQEEAKKLEESKKQEEAKKLEESKKQEEQKK
ncbi:ErpL protein [Bacillus cereus]|nr:ErpL protein [Bacillus cereus]PEW99265.1 ErpL protein [Bacillus cereus]PEY99831.1 ErpL protein [Bacillus cereus]PFH80423.1 ErpL protein [Bacillus cereus]PFV25643.1 ErpL protein [Bacillus cereus]